jgi:hypothetical protein
MAVSPRSPAAEVNDGNIAPELWVLQRAVVEAQTAYRAANDVRGFASLFVVAACVSSLSFSSSSVF